MVVVVVMMMMSVDTCLQLRAARKHVKYEWRDVYRLRDAVVVGRGDSDRVGMVGRVIITISRGVTCHVSCARSVCLCRAMACTLTAGAGLPAAKTTKPPSATAPFWPPVAVK